MVQEGKQHTRAKIHHLLLNSPEMYVHDFHQHKRGYICFSKGKKSRVMSYLLRSIHQFAASNLIYNKQEPNEVHYPVPCNHISFFLYDHWQGKTKSEIMTVKKALFLVFHASSKSTCTITAKKEKLAWNQIWEEGLHGTNHEGGHLLLLSSARSKTVLIWIHVTENI